MLDTIKKWANQKLYGIENCDNILKDVKEYLYEQRVYQNTNCNIDTSCFNSNPCQKDAGTTITCNIGITVVEACTITITEL